MPQPYLALNDGRQLPQVGLGLWQVPKDDAARVVADAIGIGYRLIDGASAYGNEDGLGEGLRRAGLARDEVFVTTKVWNDAQGYDATLRSVDDSLKRIGIDRLDLCLIHWPVPARGLYADSWRALIRLREEGRVRSIGVSNFGPGELDRIADETGVVPVLNQIELHPRRQQAPLREKHRTMGIVTQSWTPLGLSKSFDHPVIRGIADRVRRSPAQVILRWHVQLGCSVIPRSVRRERLAENLAIFDFELTPEDLSGIATLEAGERTGPDPATFG
jgi:2,5-diketo-D-gluconate reductase A